MKDLDTVPGLPTAGQVFQEDLVRLFQEALLEYPVGGASEPQESQG
jgi:hypothetical protein